MIDYNKNFQAQKLKLSSGQREIRMKGSATGKLVDWENGEMMGNGLGRFLFFRSKNEKRKVFVC